MKEHLILAMLVSFRAWTHKVAIWYLPSEGTQTTAYSSNQDVFGISLYR
jgi:hypothetical protein